MSRQWLQCLLLPINSISAYKWWYLFAASPTLSNSQPGTSESQHTHKPEVKVSTETSSVVTDETPLEDKIAEEMSQEQKGAIAEEMSQDQNQVAGGQDGQMLEEQEKMDTDLSTEEPTERMTEGQILENKQEQTKKPKITTV